MAKSKNTHPELIAQKLLDELNIKYIKHVKELPGTPDIVVESLKLVIFVHGCFWHKHSCQKITKDDDVIVKKDTEIIYETIAKGYTPFIMWECDLINNQIQVKEKLRCLLGKLAPQVRAATLE